MELREKHKALPEDHSSVEISEPIPQQNKTGKKILMPTFCVRTSRELGRAARRKDTHVTVVTGNASASWTSDAATAASTAQSVPISSLLARFPPSFRYSTR